MLNKSMLFNTAHSMKRVGGFILAKIKEKRGKLNSPLYLLLALLPNNISCV
jgi:hypothetical protein